MKVVRDEKLIHALRLIRAWRMPGGTTPNEKMPNIANVMHAAELELNRLYSALEAAQLNISEVTETDSEIAGADRVI